MCCTRTMLRCFGVSGYERTAEYVSGQEDAYSMYKSAKTTHLQHVYAPRQKRQRIDIWIDRNACSVKLDSSQS